MHFDQNKTIGALGTLIAAKWYRSLNPQSLLISLDSVETRKWMNFDDDSKRADLLGLSRQNDTAVIDILECKSGVEDATAVYSFEDGNKICGKPVDQLINTGKSISAIFGLNEWKDHLLTPPRREILRNHLYRQALSGKKNREEKQLWSSFLNSLFSGRLKPDIRLNLVLVNLGLSDESRDELVTSEGGKLRLVHLNQSNVMIHVSDPASAVVQSQNDFGQEESQMDHEKAHANSSGHVDESLETLANGTERLIVANGTSSEDLRDQITLTCGKIKAACQDFGIRVTEIDPDIVDIGPSILRYKIKLAPGEDAAKLRRQAENIARQLAATSIPIIGFLTGTHYEYLDLPRPDRQIVQLEPLLSRNELSDVNQLPLFIGVNPAGQPIQLDLGDDKLPHILVAGGTGSGKTIFLYSVVLSLVLAHSEKVLELVIIDPKQTDFTVFSRLKHLRNGELITESNRGVEVVQEIAEHEMQLRSDQLQNAKCRDIKAYNSKNPHNLMRPLVIIIDEYADLISVLGKREKEHFERVISRITARGRNVGIHLILATQRPTTDVVTGNVKANMGCRISFSLPSSRDSLVILDEPGAERLLRNGDMLLLLEGKLTRLQAYYVDPARIENLVRSRSN